LGVFLRFETVITNSTRFTREMGKKDGERGEQILRLQYEKVGKCVYGKIDFRVSFCMSKGGFEDNILLEFC